MCSHTKLLTESFRAARIDLDTQPGRYGVTDGANSFGQSSCKPVCCDTVFSLCSARGCSLEPILLAMPLSKGRSSLAGVTAVREGWLTVVKVKKGGLFSRAHVSVWGMYVRTHV